MSKEATKISVLVVDDHPIFRQGLVATLAQQADLEIIGEASSGGEAIAQFRRLNPHVTLMDLQMPGINGVEAILRIRNEFPAARLVVLTTYDTDGDIRRALRAGASGYLLKDAAPIELCEAIRAVHAGQKRIAPEINVKLTETSGSSVLSERELEVLRLMTEAKSNKEIAANLFISESTVKFHVNHILAKLNVNDRTQAVIIALKRGITRLH